MPLKHSKSTVLLGQRRKEATEETAMVTELVPLSLRLSDEGRVRVSLLRFRQAVCSVDPSVITDSPSLSLERQQGRLTELRTD